MIKTFTLNWKQEVRDYLFILIGVLCYAVGCVLFQMPFQITTGGATGVGLVIQYATGFPVQYTYILINLVLIIFALRILGWKYCVKTIYGIICLFTLLAFMQWFVKYLPFFKPYIPEGQEIPMIVKDNFTACFLGAMLEGIGLGIVFSSNGSTGGTDIVVAIINKYKNLTMGQLLMFIDIGIVTSSLFIPNLKLDTLIYSYCTLVIAGLMVDFVIDKNRQSVQFFIISRKYEVIAEEIAAVGRGVTILSGQGWYSKSDQQVLMVLAKRRESTNIFRIIHQIDPNAFVSQSKVIGVFGEGFDKMKVKKAKAAVNAEKNN